MKLNSQSTKYLRIKLKKKYSIKKEQKKLELASLVYKTRVPGHQIINNSQKANKKNMKLISQSN